VSELKIIVPENFKEFGQMVNKHIQNIRKSEDNYLIKTSLVRFNNGEGKAVIHESIRDKDLYIMSDVSNYDVSYNFFGREHYMSPDEHFMDIKRILSAECGHASKRTMIMPYLYQSRQDKKDSRESLDCAIALQELENMGINEIVTCDVHNKSVMNAVPGMAFENMYIGDMLLWDLLNTEKIDDFDKFICISPDEGAMKRARFLSDLLGNVPIGSFYKQRDYTKVVNGKNPIVDHRFLGPSDMEGKYAIISDDMIASGGSILDTALSLKKLGVERIYLIVTFALFTEGIDKFNEYYDKGIFDRVYASNVSYVPKYIKQTKWFKSVDCSYKIANVISELNYGHSIGELISGRTDTAVKIKKLRKDYEIK
jgi:ribose-phosphate pyrophosphokinase